MRDLLHDVTFAWRSAVHRPILSLVYILSLAIGMGAATGIFSLVRGVMLRPLPYPEPNQLAVIWDDTRRLGLTPAEFVFIRDANRSLVDIAAFSTGLLNFADGEGDPARVTFAAVTGAYFDVFGMNVVSGRVFTAAEHGTDGDNVIVLSHRLWTQRYGRAPDVIGRTVRINEYPSTIAGVMPAAFDHPEPGVDLWVPAQLDESALSTGNRYLQAVVRVAPNVGLAGAQSDLERVNQTYRETWTARGVGINATSRLYVVPLKDEIIGGAGRPLMLLAGAVLLMLLITCGNVANLLIARSEERKHEIGVRTALGATRTRLVWQFITENALLSTIGGALGLVLAVAIVASVGAHGIEGLPRLDAIHVDGLVLTFAAVLTVATALAFGLIATVHGTDLNINATLAGGGRLAGSKRSGRVRRSLVGAEIAIALVLVVGAGVLIRSFRGLLDVPLGFETGGVMTMEVSVPSGTYQSSAVPGFYHELTQRTADEIPVVEHVGVVSALPLGGRNPNVSFQIEGRPPHPDETLVADYRIASPGYFEAMGISLQAGRYLSSMDRDDVPLVAVINQACAARYWPNASPVSRRIRLGDESPWLTIVGVVRDVRHAAIDRPAEPELYLARAQAAAVGGLGTWRTMTLVARVRGAPARAVPMIRRVLASLDPSIPLSEIRTMDAVVSRTLSARGLATRLVGLFATATVTLAALGVYGVVAHFVRSREREIAIRRALGADSVSIARVIAGSMLRPVGAGLAGGLLGGMAANHALRGMLFAVSPLDPGVFALATVGLAGVVLLALMAGARRTLSQDVVPVLRD